MTPTVTLKISNLNNSDYPTIILRKFFNMVFVEPDGKTLNIYTATVFGGAKQTAGTGGNKSEELPIPKVVKNHACALKFAYDVHGGQSVKGRNNTTSIKFENVTEDFLKNKSKGKRTNRGEIQQVWGTITQLDGQESAGMALHDIYPDIYKNLDDLPKPDISEGVHLRFEGKKKEPSHRFVAFPGTFKEGSDNKSYTLKNQHDVAGVEAINWVKTTIELNCDILKPRIMADRKINFVVKFEQGGKYYTPDFTWYFAPPPNYIVDDSALVDVADKTEIDNIVTPVADKDTVRFDRWLEEGILERKKFRVLMKNYVAEDPYVLTDQKVEVNLSFSNPGKHGNMQFFVGMIVSHLLGFCSDLGRYETFYEISCHADSGCMCKNICRLLSMFLPFVIVFAFFACCFRQRDCMPKEDRGVWDKGMIWARWIGLAFTLILVLYINVAWMGFPSFFGNLIKTCAWNWRIIFASMFLSLLGSASYAMYCWVWKKKNLIDFF